MLSSNPIQSSVSKLARLLWISAASGVVPAGLRGGPQRHVGVAPGQREERVRDHDLGGDLRMRGAEFAEQRRQKRCQRVGRGDAHGPARAQVLAGKSPLQDVDLGQHARCRRDCRFAGRRRRIAVAGAVEQPHAEPLLHAAEPPKRVGMVELEPSGCCRKRAALADRLQ
jgi:hypothetical protein